MAKRQDTEEAGAILTREEIIEFQQLVKKVYGVKVSTQEACVMGSNLILSLELIGGLEPIDYPAKNHQNEG